MVNKLYISFDYDNCLSVPRVQRIAKKIVSMGHEVFVLTSRNDGIKRLEYVEQYDCNECVYRDAKEVGIKSHHVCFTNQSKKYMYLRDTKIQIHIDDDADELKNIRLNTKIQTFNCTLKSFEQDLMEYIKLTQEF